MTNGVHIPEPQSKVIVPPPEGALPMAGLGAGGFGIANLVINVATAADSMIPWGVNYRQRDAQLRAFWPTESYFASGLFTTIAQYAAFDWSLTGPLRTTKIAQNMLESVQGGEGMAGLLSRFLVDLFTQDNGAYMEIVRTDDDPRSPCVTLNHLDAARCIPTGRPETPVIYVDLEGRWHQLKWYQVLHMTEMPAPQEEARGIQYCALTRMLRAAQILRDISVVHQEKAAGRFTRQVHFVSGIQTRLIDQAMAQKQAAADAAGIAHYITPLIIGSIDPASRATVATIDMASIPDDWDPEKALKVYIMVMAMAFGTDYQNFAPLPGGGLGSSTESKVMNMKARGKGPGLYMTKLAQALNFRGILPRTVTFKFGMQDTAEQMEETALAKERAMLREIMVRTGEITRQVARQMAVDAGDLDERYLVMMGETNATDDIVAQSTLPATQPDTEDVEKGEPAPKEIPVALPAPNRPPNSNDKRDKSPATNQRVNPGAVPE